MSWLSASLVSFAVAASSTLLIAAAPSAAAAPASDGSGYLDSTARCGPPGTAVVFGSTPTSRVAICRTPGGGYEYRGVRVRDGARLVLPATRSSGDTFVAENSGVTYTLTANTLVVKAGNQVIREEPVTDWHRSDTSESAGAPSPAPEPSPSPSPTPLPPPLPAEVGGGSG